MNHREAMKLENNETLLLSMRDEIYKLLENDIYRETRFLLVTLC